MSGSPHQLLKILWDQYQDSDSVFRELIGLLNNRNKQLAADARIILVGVCREGPRPLINETVRPGLTPAHRAKIIAVIGDIGQPLELYDAVALVNHRRLQSKQAVEAVNNLFETLDAGPGILKDVGTGVGTRGGGRVLYAMLKALRPQSARRKAG